MLHTLGPPHNPFLTNFVVAFVFYNFYLNFCNSTLQDPLVEMLPYLKISLFSTLEHFDGKLHLKELKSRKKNR